ncbi:MAG TPA: polysaccharide biosynthesis C-terminal domain-containing protein, partial [Candidatus Limnocylindrales bacterium]|nr:polysaccharide biosynthesis C-terminal domain-containing protein [Candidatus Limnocylindrales bacterium]
MTRALLFGLTLTSTYLMARLLGTAGRGSYALISAYAGLMFVLSQLGLPSALTYFTARGAGVRAMRRLSLRLAGLLAAAVIVVGLLTMPLLQGPGLPLHGVPAALVVLAVVLVPIQLLSSMTGAILYGLRRFRRYNVIQIAQAALLVVFIATFVGLARLEAFGAVLAVVASQAVGAALVLREVGFAVGSDRAVRDGGADTVETARSASGDAATTPGGRDRHRPREVISYALRLYPSLVPSYFSYRQDVLLLGAFAIPTAQIGLYGVAVNFAEMLFYIPDSISTVLYPTVVGAQRADADRHAVRVTRFTLLATLVAGVVLIPATYAALRLLLPDFEGSMPAFLVILPAVVSLTVSKVLSSYVAGLGRPGPVTAAAIVSMLVNLAANLILIPRLGIVGASASSLISYSTQAVLL